MSNRDNFTRKTIDILGKRVGFLCSNPSCRKSTVGPNIDPLKATIIGEAAHITAASPFGPRFDENKTPAERQHIENGIWLCSNCATLVDKDENRFPVQVLQQWKTKAENEVLDKLLGQNTSNLKESPFLEADLVWAHGGRMNRGYSNKNPSEIIDGVLVRSIGNSPIIFWELDWNFSFSIHNNSAIPAYNVKIEYLGSIQFSTISKLSKVNNLPPFKSLDLEAGFIDYIESSYIEADELISRRIPPQLEGLTLRISYLDNERIEFSTIVKIINGQIMNERE